MVPAERVKSGSQKGEEGSHWVYKEHGGATGLLTIVNDNMLAGHVAYDLVHFRPGTERVACLPDECDVRAEGRREAGDPLGAPEIRTREHVRPRLGSRLQALTRHCTKSACAQCPDLVEVLTNALSQRGLPIEFEARAWALKVVEDAYKPRGDTFRIDWPGGHGRGRPLT